MIRNHIKAFIWLALACFAACGWIGESSVKTQSAVYVDWDAAHTSYAEVSRTLENADAPARLAVWTLNGDCAEYSGDWRLLTGDTLINGQPGDVMISADKALELFASVNVAGRETELNGKTRVINGVYSTGVAPVMLLNRDLYKIHAHMALCFPESKYYSWHDEAKTVLDSMGLPSPNGVKDTALLRGVSDFSFVKSLIPTRWADFDGWRDNADALVKRLDAFIRCELDPVQAECLYSCARSLVFAVLTLIFALRFIIASLRTIRKHA